MRYLCFLLVLSSCSMDSAADKRKWSVKWEPTPNHHVVYTNVDHLVYYPEGCVQFINDGGKHIALGGGTFVAEEQ